MYDDPPVHCFEDQHAGFVSLTADFITSPEIIEGKHSVDRGGGEGFEEVNEPFLILFHPRLKHYPELMFKVSPGSVGCLRSAFAYVSDHREGDLLFSCNNLCR